MLLKEKKGHSVLSGLKGKSLNLVKDLRSYIRKVIEKYWQEKVSVFQRLVIVLISFMIFVMLSRLD